MRWLVTIVRWLDQRRWHLGGLGLACLLMWDACPEMWPLTIGLLVFVAGIAYLMGEEEAEYRLRQRM